jgi:hypothetical protein
VHVSADPLVQQLVSDGEALRAAGISQGRQQAITAYFGQSAIRLTVGIFATALHEAASRMAPLSPEAAQFFGAQAQLFAEFANPPAITSVSPATDAANVRPTDQIVLGFSSPLEADSVSPDNVYVAPSSGGAHLSAQVHYDGSNTVTIIPDNGFSAGVQYTITVKQSVKSKLGQTLGADYTSTFTAAAA